MEELLPNLQTMILPKMKGKRNDRKRAWFGVSMGISRMVNSHTNCLYVPILIFTYLFEFSL